MNWHALHPAIAGTLTLLVGWYPYLQRPNRLTRLFAYSNSALVYCNAVDLLGLFPVNHSLMLYLDRLGFIGLVPTVWLFFRFTVEFAGVPHGYVESVWKWILGIGILFILASPTSFLISDIQIGHGSLTEIPGRGFPLIFIFLMGSLAIGLYYLAKQYPRTSDIRQNQIRYMALALAFPFMEAILYFLSVRFSKLYYFYYYLQVMYAGTVAYAILSHNLLDIRIVVRRTLIYSLTSATLTALSLFFMILMTRFTMTAFANQLLLSSALSALVITLIFHPLMQRIQNWVDHHFPRESLAPALLREATSGFVHEIKRPLANVTIPAELALMDIRQMRKEKNFDKLQKVEARLQYIMDQSAEAALKIEAIRDLWNTSPAPHKPIALDLLLRQVVEKQQESFRKIGAQLEPHIAEGLPSVPGNERQLEIVLTNLLKNAREALDTLEKERQRKVKLTLQNEESHLILKVQDSGPGISEEDLRRLFLPYFSTKGSKGMGVGLYLAREIIQAHHGTLAVSSEAGKGAKFVITLPVVAQ